MYRGPSSLLSSLLPFLSPLPFLIFSLSIPFVLSPSSFFFSFSFSYSPLQYFRRLNFRKLKKISLVYKIAIYIYIDMYTLLCQLWLTCLAHSTFIPLPCKHTNKSTNTQQIMVFAFSRLSLYRLVLHVIFLLVLVVFHCGDPEVFHIRVNKLPHFSLSCTSVM